MRIGKHIPKMARWLCFAAFACVLVLPGIFHGVQSLPASVSPFTGLIAAISTRKLTLLVLYCLPALIAIILIPYCFCRYVCPTGLLLDIFDKIPCPLKTRPGGNRRWPLGRWFLFLTIAGALFGYPVFLFLDPMALFTNGIASLRAPLTGISILAAALWIGLLTVSVLRPTLYCTSVCPLGEFQFWTARLRKFVITKFRSPKSNNNGPVFDAVSRRHFIGALMTGTAAGVAARFVHADTTPQLRPPGALPDPEMSAVCVRCGNCTRVCPEKIVKAAFLEVGPLNLLTPVLRFDPGHCRPECTACGAACPSGAISRLSVEQKKKHPVGLATLHVEECIRDDVPECSDCVLSCPEDAIRIEWDEQKEISLPSILADQCTGCGLCVVACKSSPKALSVIPVAQRRRTS